MLGHTMHLQGVRASQKEAVPVNTEDGSTIERLHAYDMILYHVDAPAEEWSLLTIRAELGTETTYFLCPKTEDFTTRVQNGCLSNQQGTFYVHVLNEMGATLCVETVIQNGYADDTTRKNNDDEIMVRNAKVLLRVIFPVPSAERRKHKLGRGTKIVSWVIVGDYIGAILVTRESKEDRSEWREVYIVSRNRDLQYKDQNSLRNV